MDRQKKIVLCAMEDIRAKYINTPHCDICGALLLAEQYHCVDVDDDEVLLERPICAGCHEELARIVEFHVRQWYRELES